MRQRNPYLLEPAEPARTAAFAAGILPEPVQLRCARSCTHVHERLQITIQKQLLKNARLPSGGRGRRFKSSHPDQALPRKRLLSTLAYSGLPFRTHPLRKHCP